MMNRFHIYMYIYIYFTVLDHPYDSMAKLLERVSFWPEKASACEKVVTFFTYHDFIFRYTAII